MTLSNAFARFLMFSARAGKGSFGSIALKNSLDRALLTDSLLLG
jgi:hypothetical protein